MKECIITNTDICPLNYISGNTCSPCKIPEMYTICQLTKTKICSIINKEKISEEFCGECDEPNKQTPLFKIHWDAPDGFFGDFEACSEEYAKLLAKEFEKQGCTIDIKPIKE